MQTQSQCNKILSSCQRAWEDEPEDEPTEAQIRKMAREQAALDAYEMDYEQPNVN